ncbi:MAG: hypothetical protein ABIQ04_04600 [Candidatus Saccharimonadales bacterium]
MPMIKINTAEGGTNGTAVTQANSGGASGDAFTSAVGLVGAGTVAFSSSNRAHGTLSYNVVGGSGDSVRCYLGAVGNATIATRFYLFMPTLPGAAVDLAAIQSTAFAVVITIGLDATNKLVVRDSASTVLFTATSALTANTWYRIECQAVVATATTGTTKLQYYLSDSKTAIQALSSTTANNGTTWLYRVAFGKYNTAGTLNAYYDDIAFSDESSDAIGSYSATPRKVNTYNTAEGGTHGVAVTSLNSGGASGLPFDLVTPGTGGSITFSNAPTNTGMMAYNFTSASATGSSFTWYTSDTSVISQRVYVCFTDYPTAATQFIRTYSSILMCNIAVTTAGKFFTQDNSGTVTGSTAVNTLPLNTWLRVEQTVITGTTTSNGYVHNSVYIEDTTTNPVYDFSSGTLNTTTSNSTSVAVGKLSNTGDWATFYIDDYSVQDTSYIGPANSTNSWLNTAYAVPIVASNGGGTPSLNGVVPSGVVAGSLVLMYVWASYSTGTSPVSSPFSAPSFTTASFVVSNTGSAVTVGAWLYKYAAGSDTGTYSPTAATVGGVAATSTWSNAIRITGGPSSGNPFVDTFQTATNSSGASVTVPSLSLTGTNSLILAGVCNTGFSAFTYPAGWTSAPTSFGSIGSTSQVNTGATASFTFTASAAGNLSALIGVIRGGI